MGHKSVVMGWLATVLLYVGQAGADAPPAAARIPPRQALEMVRLGTAVLVDVREADEVTHGMAAPARWFPLSRIQDNPAAFKTFLAGTQKGTVTIFYCGSGRRAEQAVTVAKELGFPALNMGSLQDWMGAGLPVVKPTMPVAPAARSPN